MITVKTSKKSATATKKLTAEIRNHVFFKKRGFNALILIITKNNFYTLNLGLLKETIIDIDHVLYYFSKYCFIKKN